MNTPKQKTRKRYCIRSQKKDNFTEKQIRYGEDRRGKRPFSYYLEEEDSKRTKELVDRSNHRHAIRMERGKKENSELEAFVSSVTFPSSQRHSEFASQLLKKSGQLKQKEGAGTSYSP